jgi:hypothetical protein
MIDAGDIHGRIMGVHFPDSLNVISGSLAVLLSLLQWIAIG